MIEFFKIRANVRFFSRREGLYQSKVSEREAFFCLGMLDVPKRNGFMGNFVTLHKSWYILTKTDFNDKIIEIRL